MAAAASQVLPRAGRRSWWILALGVLLVLCIVLAAAGAGYYLFLRATPVPLPAIAIRSPSQGQQVAVGQPVALHAVAEGEVRAVRVELWVDGQLLEVERSSVPDGTSPLPVHANWRPATAGPHTLAARAYGAKGGWASASIGVEAVADADRDGDGAPDDRDACPEQAGLHSGHGCPDRDGDGVADADDGCPGEAGPAEGDGCPAPAADDGDGDGVPDEVDLAADEPGPASGGGRPDRDGDGVPDADDACPGEPGEGADGCAASADGDDDGVPDADDACPEAWGLPGSGGCPDGDVDGVADARDLCPDEPGSAEHGGCPDSEAGDSDGDGVADDADLMPEEPGRPEDGGAPPPGEGADEDHDSIPDDAEPPTVPLGPGRFLMSAFELPAMVAVDLLEFEVDDDYHDASCYLCLTGSEPERVPLRLLEGRRWGGGVPLMGERRTAVPRGEPLALELRCGASIEYSLGPEGGWGSYFDLGTITASHAPATWDGRVFSFRSSGGDGHWFDARYRLCAGSCERVALAAPELFTYNFAGDTRLVWRWDGDRSQLAGYRLWMDGNLIQELAADAATEVSVSHLAASCGRARRFYVTAVAGAGRQSAPSNEIVFESPPCPRVVRVTFESIDTGEMGDDEWWAHGESVGPTYGNFWAQGASMERLEFWAVDYGEWWGERQEGYRLAHNTHYAVQGIFDEIWTWMQGSLTSPYDAPDRNYVDVELDAYQTLVVGGTISDSDSGNDDDTLFDGELRIPSAELAPGRYTVRDRQITLTVLVDVIVGPEAGDKPDLTISDVTQEPSSGQLQIHIFNNAAGLTSQDIDVNLVRASTNEQIGLYTWRDISLPSGGSRILQSDEAIEPWDLRAIIDPDNRIDEMDERNNICETAVVMRVEFMGVNNTPCEFTWDRPACWPFYCGDTHCLACDRSEHVFWLWAGHGLSPDEITWVAYDVRFPADGKLVACFGSDCLGKSPPEDWRMEGNPRYTFEFEMPVGESLYVLVTGAEQDVVTDDDSMGEVLAAYAPRTNWGARVESYTDTYGRPSPCDDPDCYVCREGLWAEWRITRVH